MSDLNEPVDLFLFMGQSNMAGRGIACPRFPAKAPACLEHAGYEFRAVSDPTKLYPVAEPFGVNENRPGGIYEPGMKTGSLVTAFINAYYMETQVPIIAVSAAKGGSAISEWLPGTPFLSDALQRFQGAAAFLETQSYFIRHKYMVWCQGETDGTNKTDPEKYKQRFLRMWEKLACEGIEHCFLIRIGNYNAAADPEAPLQDYSSIILAQDQLASLYPFVTMVSVNFTEMLHRGLMKDAYHYYQQAYNEVGAEAGFHTACYVNNIAPQSKRR